MKYCETCRCTGMRFIWKPDNRKGYTTVCPDCEWSRIIE